MIHPRRRKLATAWLALGTSVASLAGIQASEYDWIGQTGNWSTGTNWLDGTAPPAGGDSAAALRFFGSGSAIVATNDLAGAFTLNSLSFENTGAGTFRIAGTSPLVFAGASPTLSLDGTARALISPAMQLPVTGSLTLEGSGAGDLEIASLTPTSGGAGTLVLAGAAPSVHAQRIVLDAVNSAVSEIDLNSGNLRLNFSSGLTTPQLVVAGGTLGFNSATPAISFAGPIALQANLDFDGTYGGTLGSVISSRTAGTGATFRMNGVALLTLTAASTYTGPTIIDYASPLGAQLGYNEYPKAGTVSLSPQASLRSSSSYEIRAGGTLIFSASTANTDALSDSAPITLSGGTLTFSNTQAIASTENVGPLLIAGQGTVNLAASTGANTILRASSLVRVGQGTAFFQGTALGQSSGTGTSSLFFTQAPSLVGGGGSGPNISILPYAVGAASTTSGLPAGLPTGFVTYDPAVGVRLLTSAEYATTLAGATATQNVYITSESLSTSVKVNSLLLGASGYGGSLYGTGSLTIASGALLSIGTAGSGYIYVPLLFGSAEAIVTAADPLTISGNMTGTGGFTKAGESKLTLSGDNSGLSGPLTINGGTLSFAALSSLPGTGAIGFGGAGAYLVYTGAGDATLTRDLKATSGFVSLGNGSSTGTLTIDGTISGAGALGIGNNNSGSLQYGTIALRAGNTYTGPTYLNGGTTVIPNDSALGAGGLLSFQPGEGSATLRLAGNWATSRELSVLGGGLIDTNGFTASASGIVTGAASLTKAGAGTLTLSAASPFSGALNVTGGTLSLSGQGEVNSATASITGGELRLDNTAAALSRLSETAAVTLTNGTFTLLGNGSSPVQQKLLSLTGASGTNLVQLIPAGHATTLALGGLVNNGDLIVRGAGLGGIARVTVATALPAGADGFLSRIFASTSASGGESFATYSATAGLVPYTGYLPVSVIPAGSASADVLAQGSGSMAGSTNGIHTLTLDPAAQLSLGTGQTLQIADSYVVTRSGAATAISGGGTLDFGASAGIFETFGDFTLDVPVTGAQPWLKRGPGTLSLGPQGAGTAEIAVDAGTLRALTPDALAGKVIDVRSSGIYQTGSGMEALGGVSDNGQLTLGGGTLELGTAGKNFTFAGTLNGSGTLEVVDGGAPAAVRSFTGPAGKFSGPVNFLGGIVAFSTSSSLGSGTLTFKGASLEGITGYSSNTTISQPVVLAADLPVVSGTVVLSTGATLTGTGGLVVQPNGGVTLSVPAAYTGHTIVNGALTLTATGALASTDLEVSGTGTLEIMDSGSVPAGQLFRNATLTLDAGTFEYVSPLITATGEKIKALNISGSATLDLYSQSYNSASIGFETGSISRAKGAILNLSATAPGVPSATSTYSTFFIDQPPTLVGGGGTGPNTSIIPWLFGSTYGSGLGTQLTTYDPVNGVRFLTASEMATSVAAVTAPTNNLLLSAPVTLSAPLTVNALVLDSGSNPAPSISGSGSLKITSGVLLERSYAYSPTISVPIDFGSAEGIIVNSSNFFTISGPISGTNGLTVSGSFSTLYLSGNNPFTGQLTVDGTTLHFSTPGALGGGNDLIVLSNGGLDFDGSASATLNRNIELHGNSSLRFNSGSGMLNVTGTVSGTGSLTIYGSDSLNGTDAVEFLGANTYTGNTTVQGSLVIGSDASLGLGGAVELVGIGTSYALRLAGPWTTSRTISSDNGVIDTAGFDAQWNGPFQGFSYSFYKKGAGTLTVAGPILSAASPVYVNAGTLALAGQATQFASSVNLSAGAALILDESGIVSGHRLPATGSVTLGAGSELLVKGSATAPVTETIGTLNVAGSVIALQSDGGPSTILSVGTWSPGVFSTIEGDGLGGTTRVVFQTVPTLRGNLLPGALALDTNGSGQPTFAVYDSSTDSQGTIGVRPMRAGDYATGALLQDRNHGGAAPYLANALVTGTATAAGKTLSLNTITTSGAGTLQIAPGHTVELSAGWMLVPAGSSLTLQGGWTQSAPGSTGELLGDGNFEFDTEVSFGTLNHRGSGSVTVDSRFFSGLSSFAGNVQFGSGGPVSTASLGVSGGTLSVNSSAATIDYLSLPIGAPAVSVIGNLKVGYLYSSTSFDLQGAALSINSPGATITLNGSGTFASTLTGYAVNVSGNFAGPLFGLGGGISISGALPNVTRLEEHGGTIAIYSFAGIAPHLPLVAEGGTIQVSDASSTAGSIALSGNATILASVTGPTVVNFASLDRALGGTALFSPNFSTLGGTPGSTGVVNLTFTSPLTGDLVGNGATVPVLPYAVVEATTQPVAYRLATYDPVNGVRPLALSEYATTLQDGADVRLTATGILTAPITLNALHLANGTGLAGAFTATLASGALLAESGGSVASETTLNFGPAMGYLYSYGTGTSSLSLQGTLTGSGGLSFNGNARIDLKGTNSVTGPIVLNSGTVGVPGTAALGPGSDAVQLYEATMEFSGASFTRPISLLGQRGTIKGTAGGTISGLVSGSGNVVWNGVTIAGANTYTGTTDLQGAISLAGPSPLGQTSQVNFSAASTIALGADWTNAVPALFSNSSVVTLDTHGFSAHFSGPLIGYGTFTKTGAGQLTLDQTERFTGNLSVTGGTLDLEGVASLNTALTVGALGTLIGNGQLLTGVTVNGTLNPGEGTGTLGVGNATFNTGSTLALTLDSAESFNALDVSGTLAFNGTVNLQLDLEYAPTNYQDFFTVILNNGSDPVSGMLSFNGATLTEGEKFNVNGQDFMISYQGGDGNDVTLEAVPEPGNIGLLLAGATLLLGWRKRAGTRKQNP